MVNRVDDRTYKRDFSVLLNEREPIMADNNYDELFNSDVVDVEGNKIGSIGQVYLDDMTGQPSWITVKTGWFGLKETFVPLERAVAADGTITVPYTAEKVKDAPRVDPDKHLDADEESQLYAYYGIAAVVSEEQDADDLAEQAVEPEVSAPEASEPDASEPGASDEVVVAGEQPAELPAADESAMSVTDEHVAESGLLDDEVLVADETPHVDEEVAVDEAVAAPEVALEAPARLINPADLYDDVKN